MASFAFYMDLRCPFCFVQSRRLRAARFEGVIEPRPVRHERELPVPARAPSEEELARFADYRARLADLTGILVDPPRLWPNTHRASLAIAAATRLAPAQALDLAALLFDAFWLEGRDPSDGLVVHDCATRAGIRMLDPDARDEAMLRQIERVFAEKAGEWRTPTLVSESDAAFVGLGDERRLAVFLRSGRLGYEDDDVCDV